MCSNRFSIAPKSARIEEIFSIAPSIVAMASPALAVLRRSILDTEFRGDLGLNPEVKNPINNRASFYDTLPLTDTHGHPVDEHSDDHHEDKEHH